MTIYSQLRPGERKELGSFTPAGDTGKGLPYFADLNEGYLVFLDEKKVKSVRLDNWKDQAVFTLPYWAGEDAKLSTFHYGDLGEEGRYYVYLDDHDYIWLDTRFIDFLNIDGERWKIEKTKISGFAGNYIYSIQYDDNPLSRLTYLPDYKSARNSETSGWGLASIWMEDWSYQRIPIKRSLFAEKAGEQEQEEAEETEAADDPLVKYPAPQIESRNDRALYDKTYIVASKYSAYVGPQKRFWFEYPTRFYDNVDYTLENDGADISIIFTCSGDPSYLEVSVHPLPEGTEDLKSYAEAWRDKELAGMYNGRELNFKEYDGEYRFRVQGWTEMGSGVSVTVICRADQESIMKMVLKVPNGTDSTDSEVKEYYRRYMNYRCGFGIPVKAPTL